MRNNSLKAAFQYKRIDLSNVNKFDSKKAENMGATLKQIWNYLKMEKGKLFLVILMVFISSIFALLGPFLVGMSIDNFIAVSSLMDWGFYLWGWLLYILSILCHCFSKTIGWSIFHSKRYIHCGKTCLNNFTGCLSPILTRGSTEN